MNDDEPDSRSDRHPLPAPSRSVLLRITAAVGAAGLLTLSAATGASAATSVQGWRLPAAGATHLQLHATDTSDSGESGPPVNLQLGAWTAHVYNHGAYLMRASATISWGTKDAAHTGTFWFRSCTVEPATSCNSTLHAQDCCVYSKPGEIDGIPDGADITFHLSYRPNGNPEYLSFPEQQQPSKTTVPDGLCLNTWGVIGGVTSSRC
jgi:hypothetical protein